MEEKVEKPSYYQATRQRGNYQTMEYIFEDNSAISFKLKQTDFPHLLGLHKLIDIPVIRQFNDKNNRVISAKYILFEKKKRGYNHLCIAEDGNGKKYAESFFFSSTDLYIRNQKAMKVKYIRIYDKFGVWYFEDVLL